MKKNKSHEKFNPSLVKLRKARSSDVSKLLIVENKCFDYDQLSRRNFDWMIKKAKSIFIVLEYKSELIGYGLVLMNRGTSLARLYSICTRRQYQGYGLASRLIKELE